MNESVGDMDTKFWSATAKRLTPYVPGEQPRRANLIKLNTNENPYPPSPQVQQAIQDELTNKAERLRLYPDPTARELCQTLASHYGLHIDQVFVGNGSDEVLAHVFVALLQQDRPILFPDISYSFYPVYCQLFGIDFQPIPLNENYQIDIQDYSRPHGGIIFPNPNAPTGSLLALEAIETLLRQHPDTVMVVDEAYIDFADCAASAIPLIDRHPNLLVVQTLSKSRSLAGLRVGFALGQAPLIQALTCVKDSFNSYPLDRLALAGAIASFKDPAYFETTCRRVIDSRANLAMGLKALGFEVLPSAANFIFVRHPQQDAAQLAMALRNCNIIVRHFRQPRIEQFLRITIGTEDQCQALLAALQTLLTTP